MFLSMVDSQIYDILKDLSMGDRVRIHPNTESVSTPAFQPQDPFDTEVKWVNEEETRDDSYFDEDEGVTKRWDSIERKIALEPHPNDDDAEEYVARYKRFMDGHEIGGGVSTRSYFTEDGKRYSSENGGFAIERIELVD
jgi:hypothetical protein